MIPHLKQSRIVKALTDRASNKMDFDGAEACLSQVRIAIVCTQNDANTAAGQAAVLTAVATSFKCFGNAVLVADSEIKLVKSLSIGDSLGAAASSLGARIVSEIPTDSTHAIVIGHDEITVARQFVVRCWWDGWLAGVVPRWDDRPLGASGNPLAGVFAGALAVREIFATVLNYPRAGSRVSITSLWEPWLKPTQATAGPVEVYMPPKIWFIGLGHLGQGFLWSLGLLPAAGNHAVLQDDQTVGSENEATGLLTTGDDIGQRKTRVASRWLEGAGWPTSLIERRHHGDMPLSDDDPAIVMTGLDDPIPRIQIAGTGFLYMIDAGVGHGPADFESLQIRLLKKGSDATAFWSKPEKPKDIDAILQEKAYQSHAATSGNCGTVSLAQASVAVPFVGAAVGALAIAQAIRLACMLKTVQIMHMELAAPEMVEGGLKDAPDPGDPDTAIGSIRIVL